MLPFPEEVLNSIIDNLDPRDTKTLLRVNTEFNHVVSSRARSRLELSEDTDGHVTIAAHGNNIPLLRRHWLPTMVTSLDLRGDNLGRLWRFVNGQLDPRQIRLVRLFDPDFGSTLEIIEGVHFTSRRYGLPICRVEPHVREKLEGKSVWCLPATLRPTTLVLRRHNLIVGCQPGPHLCLDHLLINISHFVVVFTDGLPGTATQTLWFEESALDGATELTVVFPTASGEYWKPKNLCNAPSQWINRQFRLLCLLIFNRSRSKFRLTIVNAGSIDPDCIDYGHDHETSAEGRADRQAHLEHLTLERLWATSVPPGHPPPNERMRFCSMEEWIAEGSADGVLNQHEIEQWLATE